MSGCKDKDQANHQITIDNGKVTPSKTYGHLCDRIIITNTDDKSREMAFGQHDNHVIYDGVDEKTLEKDQILTVTLNKTGEFLFHDHDQDETWGIFIVTM